MTDLLGNAPPPANDDFPSGPMPTSLAFDDARRLASLGIVADFRNVPVLFACRMSAEVARFGLCLCPFLVLLEASSSELV